MTARADLEALTMVPYDDLDPLVRELVRVLNEIWGLRTTASCQGHGYDEVAYVSFVSADLDTVRALLSALPLLGWRGGFAWNRPVAKAVWVTASPDSSGLRFDLTLSGYPEYARKELIVEVESCLRAAPKGG